MEDRTLPKQNAGFDQKDKLLKGFLAIEGKQVMSKEDEKVISTVKPSKKWVDGKYKVAWERQS